MHNTLSSSVFLYHSYLENTDLFVYVDFKENTNLFSHAYPSVIEINVYASTNFHK